MKRTPSTLKVPGRTLKKYEKLKALLSEMGRVLVAFSGGVDSTLLLRTAHDVLGRNALAVTASAEVHTPEEVREARSIARDLGIPLRVVRARLLDDPDFVSNPPERCYHCKRRLFSRFLAIAAGAGARFVVDGSNADDASDFRPGVKALRELGVRSPLREAGLVKREVRLLSRALGLRTAAKPARACLASRFPYGTKIVRANLKTVGAAEALLRKMGFDQVRVRHHGAIARLEVEPSLFAKLMKASLRGRIVRGLKKLGYHFVALDMEGYRTGSLNETLKKL